MGKGRAPSSLEMYIINKKEGKYEVSNSFFVGLGDNHQERVENYVKFLDRKIEKELKMK